MPLPFWEGTNSSATDFFLHASDCIVRYKDEDHKAKQFPVDCREIANMQKIYAADLKERGIIDRILWEYVSFKKNYQIRAANDMSYRTVKSLRTAH